MNLGKFWIRKATVSITQALKDKIKQFFDIKENKIKLVFNQRLNTQ